MINELPYTVITKKLGPEAEQWCKERMGERWYAVGRKTGNWTYFWEGRTAPKNYKWHFRNERDAVIFSLRWS